MKREWNLVVKVNNKTMVLTFGREFRILYDGKIELRLVQPNRTVQLLTQPRWLGQCNFGIKIKNQNKYNMILVCVVEPVVHVLHCTTPDRCII